MAMTSTWDNVVERFQSLEQYAPLRPIVDAMLDLVAVLREDPRLDGLSPDVSHAALTLRLGRHPRYVIVERGEVDGFAVSFVDGVMEFSDTRSVPEAEAVATIVEYVEQVRRHKDSP
jgi:hypothetical protein